MTEMNDKKEPKVEEGRVVASPELNAAIDESLKIGLTERRDRGDVRLSKEMLDIIERLIATETVITLWQSAPTVTDRVRLVGEITRSALEEYAEIHPLTEDQMRRMSHVTVVIIAPILFELFAQLPHFRREARN